MIHEEITALDYFDALCQKKPDFSALEDVSKKYTFAEMERAINSLSWSLSQKIKDECRQPSIAILLERGTEFVISMLAVWKLGGYFVPLNVKWPKDRLRNILELCDHDIVITNSSFENISKNAVIFDKMLIVDEGIVIFKPVKPSSIAYSIFTSGSTGMPKGVAISHKSFREYIGWTKRYFWEYRCNKKLLLTSELTFDITMGDVAFFLAFGTTVFVAPDPQNFLSIVSLLRKEKIDTFYSVPTTHSGVFGFLRRKPDLAPDNLNLILSGGDVFSLDLVKDIHSLVPKAHFYNVYGPTEVTINCYALRLDDKIDHLESVGKIPIGMPFDNIDSVILDEK